MAIYRQVYMSFWTDQKVDDCFEPEDKYFYLYLLTNPHTNLCGCYEISERQLAQETGLTGDVIHQLIDRLQQTLNVIRYDPETHEVLLLNWHKYNWTKSEKLAKAIRESISYVKNQAFKNYLLQILNSSGEKIPYPYPIGTVSVPYLYPTDTSVAAADAGTVTVSDTVPEVTHIYPENKDLFLVWCRETGIAEDFATKLYDRYSANGWRDNKGEPIRVWQNVFLNAWRIEKKNSAAKHHPQPAAESYNEDDLIEWPYGSGQYRLRREVEGAACG